MYKNKLAIALKSAGKVLREFGDEVYVPFGSEYSIFIKNLNSVRALVSVSVDGEDVGEGTKFVVEANDSIDLERFIKNGNYNAGNRFKFIERTSAVENHRGIGVEDGLVRVEFQFEKPAVTTYWNFTHRPDYWRQDAGGGFTVGGTGNVGRGQVTLTSSASSVSSSANANSVNVSSNVSQPVNDAGVTVPGSVSNQQFVDAGWFPVETEAHVMVLKILGETKDNVQVRKPVTVKAKPKCTTCGTANKARARFCTECGTSLQIV
jgi:hypothetical protein